MSGEDVQDQPSVSASKPILYVEHTPDGTALCVWAHGPRLGLAASQSGRLGSLLRVRVVDADVCDGEELPEVSGDYRFQTDEICFVPHFPFRAGIEYRAILDVAGLSLAGPASLVTETFYVLRDAPCVDPRVIEVFPTSNVLPENLLRFCVKFSNAMQRGHVAGNVAVLDEHGNPTDDVLYRPPAELWSRDMTCLTILLDPGRLKRSVGPNRMLGPPLQAGQRYTLRIGSGMIDGHGQPLPKDFSKTFLVAAAQRERISVGSWTVRPPSGESREAIAVAFPQPLDWMQLWSGILVVSETHSPIAGRIEIDSGGIQWRFIPEAPWRTGMYRLLVASALEDICGNTPDGPFDGPIRQAEVLSRENSMYAVDFFVPRA